MIKQNLQNGFSIMEMLLAMVILILAITAVILVSFGNQSVLSDSQTNTEALNKAQDLIEQEQALARKDFNLVNPSTSTDGIYTKTVSVEQQPDYFTKKVTATITWTGDRNRNETTSLTAFVTNFENALGGNTCNSQLTPNADAWKTPHIKNTTTDLAALAGISGTYPITDVDVYKNKIYVTTSNSSVNQNTFFIFDATKLINNQANPLISKMDNDAVNSSGLNSVAVADDVSGSGKVYAYVANGSGVSVGQLQIIDTSTMTIVKTLKIPGVSGTTGVGNTIFYKNGYIYLGLKSTGSGHGPEFHIIDVHQPSTASEVGFWPPSGNMGNDINAIYMKGQYVYLATPNSRQLTVLDIHDPFHPALATPSAGFTDPVGSGNGKSLYSFGNTLYLGRTNSAGSEFYILNNSDPTNISTNNPTPQSLNVGSSVDGINIRVGLDTTPSPSLHNLAFIISKTNFQIWDTLDLTPWTPNKVATEFLSLPSNGSLTFEPVFDCEGNNFFAASNNSSDQGSIYIIAP